MLAHTSLFPILGVYLALRVPGWACGVPSFPRIQAGVSGGYMRALCQAYTGYGGARTIEANLSEAKIEGRLSMWGLNRTGRKQSILRRSTSCMGGAITRYDMFVQ